MKLNNRGWGIGVMIAFVCVFIAFILTVAILAYRMGMGQKPSVIKEVEEQTSENNN